MATHAISMKLLEKPAKRTDISLDDEVVRNDLNLFSIAYTEFIMDVEEEFGVGIDLDQIDIPMMRVGAMFDRLEQLVMLG